MVFVNFLGAVVIAGIVVLGVKYLLEKVSIKKGEVKDED